MLIGQVEDLMLRQEYADAEDKVAFMKVRIQHTEDQR